MKNRHNGNHGLLARLLRGGDLVTREFYLVIGIFVVITLCLLALDRFQAYVLDSVRAYVGGEGLWSKGQKDAAYHLARYAATSDSHEYEAYLQGISAALGDHRARVALQADPPDIAAARQGLLDGRNNPADVDKLISLFLHFGNISYMKKAIAIWTEGDANIDELRELGSTLDKEIRSGRRNPQRIHEIMRRLDVMNARVAKLEDRFSATLGDAARSIGQLTREVMIIATLLLLALGTVVSRQIVRGIRKTQRELEISEARFRRIVESNIIGIAFWNADGSILDANDAFLECIGFTHTEMRNGEVNWRELTPPEFQAGDEQALKEIRETGSSNPFEKQLLHKSGRRINVLIGAASLGESPDSGVCFVLDISEQRRLEQELKHSQKMEAIGTLVGGIAHEFNNDLAAVQGNLFLARQHGKDNAELLQRLDKLESLVERSAEVVRRLMTFARKDIVRMQPILLNDFFREFEATAHAMIPAGIAFDMHVCEQPLPIVGDAAQLQRMMQNLLDNALSAVDGVDGATIQCTLQPFESSAPAGNATQSPVPPLAHIVVRDNGCGMGEEELSHIFDPFYTTREVGEGTGLGMSMVYGSVQTHKGDIEISSKPGEGMSVDIYLPLDTAQHNAGNKPD